MQIDLSWKWLLQSKLTLYLPRDEYVHAHFFEGSGNICHQKFSKKALFDRVVSHLQEKVGSTSVLSREHLPLVVVAGLDKATISIHRY